MIAFRVSMLAALQMRKENIIYKNAGIMTTMLSACINLAIIMILNIVSLSFHFVLFFLFSYISYFQGRSFA